MGCNNNAEGVFSHSPAFVAVATYPGNYERSPHNRDFVGIAAALDGAGFGQSDAVVPLPATQFRRRRGFDPKHPATQGTSPPASNAGLKDTVPLGLPGITPSLLALAALFACMTASAADWTHHAADAQRSSRSVRGPADFSAIRWTVALNADEAFITGTSPVISDSLVILPLRRFVENVHEATLLSAWDTSDGGRCWTTPLLPDFDSSCSAAIDVKRGLVYYGSDTRLYALRLSDGSEAWHADLPVPIVNASPVVTSGLTSDGVPANRMLITDFASAGRMYAINIDSRDAVGNPYDLGEQVWSAPVASTSGATPSLSGATAYVAGYQIVNVPPSVTQYRGIVRAFDARTGAPIWMRDVGANDGFFGGVAVAGGHVFAATYDFFGGASNSRLFKLRADDGARVWDVPCERTSSIPIVGDGGLVFLSGGISGFGSQHKLQCFRDHGLSATLEWGTSVASGLSVGGWKYQPALAYGRLFIGTESVGAAAPYTAAYLLNPYSQPGAVDFVVDGAASFGGPPGLAADGTLFTYGVGGLRAYAALLPGDLNCDNVISVGDIGGFVLALTNRAAYEAQYPNCNALAADANFDGVVSVGDIAAFVALLTGGTTQ